MKKQKAPATVNRERGLGGCEKKKVPKPEPRLPLREKPGGKK